MHSNVRYRYRGLIFGLYSACLLLGCDEHREEHDQRATKYMSEAESREKLQKLREQRQAVAMTNPTTADTPSQISHPAVVKADLSKASGRLRVGDAWAAAFEISRNEYAVGNYYLCAQPVQTLIGRKVGIKHVYTLPSVMWTGLTPEDRDRLIKSCDAECSGSWEIMVGEVVRGDIMSDRLAMAGYGD